MAPVGKAHVRATAGTTWHLLAWPRSTPRKTARWCRCGDPGTSRSLVGVGDGEAPTLDSTPWDAATRAEGSNETVSTHVHSSDSQQPEAGPTHVPVII